MDELKQILQQLQAAVQEVMAAVSNEGAAPEAATPEAVEMECDNPDKDKAAAVGGNPENPEEITNPEDSKDKIMEAISVLSKSLLGQTVKKQQSAGVSGLDPAEARISEGTEVNDKNAAILKALQGILAKINKSTEQIQATNGLEKSLANVFKPIVERMDQQDFILKSILEGQGITENVLSSAVKKSQPPAPVQSTDNQAILDLFTSIAKSLNQNQNPGSAEDQYNRIMKSDDLRKQALCMTAGLDPSNPSRKLYNVNVGADK